MLKKTSDKEIAAYFGYSKGRLSQLKNSHRANDKKKYQALRAGYLIARHGLSIDAIEAILSIKERLCHEADK